ncbi:LOW QUALITY PROTEIN: sialidase-1 [Ciconia boyciana]|uniref:LOW QUALITY PROTEIN: sialidase-1 n=1 Tax=Ciconia boyciana TaxID=52775 RepID=UPI003BA0CA9F
MGPGRLLPGLLLAIGAAARWAATPETTPKAPSEPPSPLPPPIKAPSTPAPVTSVPPDLLDPPGCPLGPQDLWDPPVPLQTPFQYPPPALSAPPDPPVPPGAPTGGAGAAAVGERGGARGVHTFRVPLVAVTPGGALLACAEGRKRSAADVGAKVIACRRSPDGGATWGPTRVAADDGSAGDGLSLGALAVAGEEVLLLFARCAHPAGCGPPSTHLLRSRDGGRSWGPPQNLSGVVGNEVFAPGPGYGTQKQRAPGQGRLVFCGHGTLERDGVSLLLSDDGGRRWRRGGALPAIPFGAPRHPRDFTPDECQPYELPDGSIAVNIRNQNAYRCRCRMVARSWDGGETLPPAAVTFDPALVDPVVAAGVLVTGGLVFFSNPAHESQRVNLTLRWSFTNGTTWWGRGLQVWAGPSGYSSMAAPPPSAQGDAPLLYLIYEKGRSLSTETVSLATISIAGDL